jgi:hypothetical protein
MRTQTNTTKAEHFEKKQNEGTKMLKLNAAANGLFSVKAKGCACVVYG